MEDVSVFLTGKITNTLMNAKLYAPHQRRRLKLLVSHLPTLHTTVTQLLTLQHLGGVVC